MFVGPPISTFAGLHLVRGRFSVCASCFLLCRLPMSCSGAMIMNHLSPSWVVPQRPAGNWFLLWDNAHQLYWCELCWKYADDQHLLSRKHCKHAANEGRLNFCWGHLCRRNAEFLPQRPAVAVTTYHERAPAAAPAENPPAPTYCLETWTGYRDLADGRTEWFF